MSVALVYGAAFPVWAAPLLLLALLVGFSRVRLRVHYPSDVLVGQLIAGLSASLLASI
jgi:undecaprenyl-diphosphatase